MRRDELPPFIKNPYGYNADDLRELPEDASTAGFGRFNVNDGFPDETERPLNMNGAPVNRGDMNSLFNDISKRIRINYANGSLYDEKLSKAINGYWKGAISVNNDGKIYMSLIDDNIDAPPSDNWKPVSSGKNGENGKDGASIVAIFPSGYPKYDNKKGYWYTPFTIKLSDGSILNNVQMPSVKGKDGTNGKDGKNGKDGTNGKDGASVKNITIDGTDFSKNGKTYYNLKTTLTDGSNIPDFPIEVIQGPKGDNGKDGKEGIGLAKITNDGPPYQKDNKWYIDLTPYLSDGTKLPDLQVPALVGPQGPPGVPVDNRNGPPGREVIVLPPNPNPSNDGGVIPIPNYHVPDNNLAINGSNHVFDGTNGWKFNVQELDENGNDISSSENKDVTYDTKDFTKYKNHKLKSSVEYYENNYKVKGEISVYAGIMPDGLNIYKSKDGKIDGEIEDVNGDEWFMFCFVFIPDDPKGNSSISPVYTFIINSDMKTCNDLNENSYSFLYNEPHGNVLSFMISKDKEDLNNYPLIKPIHISPGDFENFIIGFGCVNNFARLNDGTSFNNNGCIPNSNIKIYKGALPPGLELLKDDQSGDSIITGMVDEKYANNYYSVTFIYYPSKKRDDVVNRPVISPPINFYIKINEDRSDLYEDFFTDLFAVDWIENFERIKSDLSTLNTYYGFNIYPYFYKDKNNNLKIKSIGSFPVILCSKDNDLCVYKILVIPTEEEANIFLKTFSYGTFYIDSFDPSYNEDDYSNIGGKTFLKLAVAASVGTLVNRTSFNDILSNKKTYITPSMLTGKERIYTGNYSIDVLLPIIGNEDYPTMLKNTNLIASS